MLNKSTNFHSKSFFWCSRSQFMKYLYDYLFVLLPLLFLVGGFLYVDEILGKPRFKKYTVDDVKSVVESNDKQRFYMETEPDSGRFKIRANQGHTLEVLIIKPQIRIVNM
jgi:hypothetical protein